MKLIFNKDSGMLELITPTTDKGEHVQEFPTYNVHRWYPFNINFHYKYSNAKKHLYLVKDSGYDGENLYNVDILKKTKPPVIMEDGVMFHPYVYKRNRYIINKARQIGIPTIRDNYTLSDVEQGFDNLRDALHVFKSSIETRVLNNNYKDTYVKETWSEDWDKFIYSHMTEKEEKVLIELGEMYSMLTVMRKICGGG